MKPRMRRGADNHAVRAPFHIRLTRVADTLRAQDSGEAVADGGIGNLVRFLPVGFTDV
jgi:hypothetical protein